MHNLPHWTKIVCKDSCTLPSLLSNNRIDSKIQIEIVVRKRVQLIKLRMILPDQTVTEKGGSQAGDEPLSQVVM